jgi:hypothetical protein
MYALIELVHGDYGPTFDTREDADAALARMASLMPGVPPEFGVFELDPDGFPIDAPVDEPAARSHPLPVRLIDT